MKNIFKLIGILGFLILIGVCNDTATLTQTIVYSLIGFALITLTMLFAKHQHYYVDFVAPNGQHKKVRAYNLITKLMVIHKYNKLGYKVCNEWEVII